eukprot:PhF_6_TR13547/c0_g1_i4/m.21654
MMMTPRGILRLKLSQHSLSVQHRRPCGSTSLSPCWCRRVTTTQGQHHTHRIAAGTTMTMMTRKRVMKTIVRMTGAVCPQMRIIQKLWRMHLGFQNQQEPRGRLLVEVIYAKRKENKKISFQEG